MESSPTTFTTSELAIAADVGSQTLRYYERRGLLPEPPRTRGGHRIYGPQHLERLLLIQQIQRLGFHLEEIHGLLKVREDPCESTEASRLVEKFIDRIDRKAEDLSAMRVALARIKEQALADLRKCPDAD